MCSEAENISVFFINLMGVYEIISDESASRDIPPQRPPRPNRGKIFGQIDTSISETPDLETSSKAKVEIDENKLPKPNNSENKQSSVYIKFYLE